MQLLCNNQNSNMTENLLYIPQILIQPATVRDTARFIRKSLESLYGMDNRPTLQPMSTVVVYGAVEWLPWPILELGWFKTVVVVETAKNELHLPNLPWHTQYQSLDVMCRVIIRKPTAGGSLNQRTACTLNESKPSMLQSLSTADFSSISIAHIQSQHSTVTDTRHPWWSIKAAFQRQPLPVNSAHYTTFITDSRLVFVKYVKQCSINQ